jgi:hypothetical protein
MNLRLLHALADLACDAVEAIIGALHSNRAADELWHKTTSEGGRGRGKDVGQRAERPSGANFDSCPTSPPPRRVRADDYDIEAK